MKNGSGKSIHQLLTERLQKFITADRLRQGDPLPTERELMRQLGVSRSTLRETLKIMELAGFVTRRQGGGTFVGDFDASGLVQYVVWGAMANSHSLLDFVEARRVIEPAVVSLATLRMSDCEIQDLEALMTRNQEGLSNGEGQTTSLHVAIARGCGNAVLANLITALNHFFLELATRTHRMPGRLAQTYEEHLEIVQAMRSRDPEKATVATLRHIDGIAENLYKAVGAGLALPTRSGVAPPGEAR